MKVAFDTTVLSLVLKQDSKPPTDLSTGKPLKRAKARVELLIKTLEANGAQIIVPTPVISELLTILGMSAVKYITFMEQSNNFSIQPFGILAATELAEINRQYFGKAKSTDPIETKAKLKFDRQIVAIAKVSGVTTLYVDDKGMAKYASSAGLSVVKSWELPLPPLDPQRDFLKKEEE